MFSEKGDQGEKGADGKDGASPVVVLNGVDGVITGGTVTSDKAYVFEGDSVVFEFTPDEGMDILLHFTINGKEIDVEPTATSYTYSVDEVESLMVTAEFTNLQAYAADNMVAHYNALADADSELASLTSGAVTDLTVDQTAKKRLTTYADSTIASYVAGEYADIATDIAALDSSLTVSEKLAKVDEMIAAVDAKVDEMYATVLETAKTAAKAQAETVLTGVETATADTGKYDKTRDLATATASIEAATTLKEIAGIVKNASDAASLNGTVDTLAAGKTLAYTEISTALATVTGEQSVLSDKDALADLEEDLADLGVEVSSLPTEIASSYYDQIEAATSIELNSDDTTVLGTEGAKKISSSLDTLLSDIKSAVLKEYLDEVDASAYLNEDGNSTIKSRVISTLTTTANEWYKTAITDSFTQKSVKFSFDIASSADAKNIGDNKGNVAIADFYKVESSTSDSVTLRGALEDSLVSSLSDKNYVTERLDKVKTSALASLSAKVSEILNGDADYKKATTRTAITGDTKVKVYKAIGSTGATVDNPFYTVTGDADEDGYVTVSSETTARVALTVEGVSTQSYGDVSYYYNEVAKTAINAGSTASAVLVAEEGYLDDLDAIYAAAKKEYADDQKVTITLDGGVYVTIASLKTAFVKNVYGSTSVGDAKEETIANLSSKGTTMSDISAYAKATLDNIDVLKTLDGAIVKRIASEDIAADTDFVKLFNGGDTVVVDTTNNVSSARAALTDLIDGLLDGSKGEADVTSFITDTNLASLYEDEVTAYLSEAKASFTEAVQNLKKGQTPEVIRKLDTVSSTWLSLLGKSGADDSEAKGYKDSNITSINAWLAAAVTAAETASSAA